MGSHSISAMVPFVVARVAAARGADPEPLLRGTGISPDAPPPAEEHLAADLYFAVWRRAVAVCGPSLPFTVAATFQLEDHEVFGFLALACETLGRAYERTAAYRALYCTGARWELEPAPDAVRLVWYPWPGDLADPGYVAAQEFAVADMVDAIRRLGATRPVPHTVTLATRTDSPEARSAFGVPPTHGRHFELAYAPGLAELPIGSFNSRLRDYFDAVCRELVGKLATDDSLVAQIRKQLIGAMDGGDTAMPAIAKRLGMSTRSIQRRLSEEGTRYADLLAEIQLELAKRYLARGGMAASDVAYLVGFAEPPAFFKAFKRWTGMTPRQFQTGTT